MLLFFLSEGFTEFVFFIRHLNVFILIIYRSSFIGVDLTVKERTQTQVSLHSRGGKNKINSLLPSSGASAIVM